MDGCALEGAVPELRSKENLRSSFGPWVPGVESGRKGSRSERAKGPVRRCWACRRNSRGPLGNGADLGHKNAANGSPRRPNSPLPRSILRWRAPDARGRLSPSGHVHPGAPHGRVNSWPNKHRPQPPRAASKQDTRKQPSRSGLGAGAFVLGLGQGSWLWEGCLVGLEGAQHGAITALRSNRRVADRPMDSLRTGCFLRLPPYRQKRSRSWVLVTPGLLGLPWSSTTPPFLSCFRGGIACRTLAGAGS